MTSSSPSSSVDPPLRNSNVHEVITIQQALASLVWQRAHEGVVHKRLIQDGEVLWYAKASGPHFVTGAPLTTRPLSSSSWTPQEEVGGEMRFPAWPRLWSSNRKGSMHGGFIAALIDGLVATHMFTALRVPNSYSGVTVHLDVNYLLPVPIVRHEGDRRGGLPDDVSGTGVVFHSRLDRLGGSSAFFSVWVTRMSNPEERLVTAQLVKNILQRRRSKTTTDAIETSKL